MQVQPVPHLSSTWGTSVSTVKSTGVPKYLETLIHWDIKLMQIIFYFKYILNIYFFSEEYHIAIG